MLTEEVVGIAAFQPSKSASGWFRAGMDGTAPDKKQLTQQLAQIMAQVANNSCGQRPSG